MKFIRSIADSRIDSRGAALAGFASLVLIALVFVGGGFWIFGKVVPPNFIGVRQNYFSLPLLSKGFAETGLEPGLHWTIPYVSEVKLLPRTFQYVHFNDAVQLGDLGLASLDVPTRDGSKVKTDVTLIVRLFDRGSTTEEAAPTSNPESEDKVPMVTPRKRAHGGPRELIESFKLEPKQQLQVFSQTSEDSLRQSLGRLSTIDYYNPAKRESAALEAFEAINTAVNPKGVELWGALIRRYAYLERSIDDQIFQKNLQDQTERMNAALSRLAGAQAETEREQALWDANIRDLEVKSESQVRVIRSEGTLDEVTKVSEGDRLVAEAKAKVDEARAGALSQLQGAQLYTAREMVPLLKTLQGGVIANLDPYDISAWVKRLARTDSRPDGRSEGRSEARSNFERPSGHVYTAAPTALVPPKTPGATSNAAETVGGQP